MAESDTSEKTEEPSRHKLDEAKKKGSVFRSMEVGSFFILLVGLIMLLAIGSSTVEKVLHLCQSILVDAGQLSFSLNELLTWLKDISYKGVMIVAPLTLVVMMAGVAVSLLQTGFVFTFFPIKPDIKRLNPVEGFKRVFGTKLMFDSVKNILKLMALSTILYFAVVSAIPRLITYTAKPIQTYSESFMSEMVTLLGQLLIALAFVAVVDFVFSRWEFMRKMKMSKHEVKEEHKRREGDPRIKAKRKEIQDELRQKMDGSNGTPGADLIITNPTHYAVGLKYDRENMHAPIVVSKGRDQLALKIRSIASSHRIPIYEDKPLARQLYAEVNISNPVPEETYYMVAKWLREAYAGTTSPVVKKDY